MRVCVRQCACVCACVRACASVNSKCPCMFGTLFLQQLFFLFSFFYYSYRYLFFCLHKHLLDILEGFSLLLLGCSGTFHQS